MSDAFTERLGRRVAAGAAPAVVGLDPRLEALPVGVAAGEAPAQRILAFYSDVIPLIARHVPAVKPNVAYFERLGAPGWALYLETCALARAVGLLVIGDVKRGDIGATAEAYAAAHCEHVDAVTLHPYLGEDAIAPFLRRGAAGLGLFVLVRTSNPSSGRFQTLATEAGRLCDVVADSVDEWGRGATDSFGYSAVGAVVAATFPDELAGFRSRMPRAWFLIPGVGAQGGRIGELAAAFDARGLGAIVAQSRGILECFAPDDPAWRSRVDDALVNFTDELNSVCRPAT